MCVCVCVVDWQVRPTQLSCILAVQQFPEGTETIRTWQMFCCPMSVFMIFTEGQAS